MFENMSKRIVIGLTETIEIFGKDRNEKLVARVDTGAEKSSIDKGLAKDLKLGPVIKRKLIKSAHGSKRRPIISVKIGIAGKKMKCHFTVADRRHLKYKVLIGQNVLKKGFIIDPLKGLRK